MKHLRFTLDGGPALEEHLAKSCGQVLDGVLGVIPRTKLQGLLLGGGYGRGEGGVLRGSAGEQPYNDLEFYVLMRGWPLLNERAYSETLHAVGHKLSSDVGVDVEFKILSLAKLRNSPINMFYYDLLMGHRWLYGGEQLLAGCEHHQLAETIPLSEATRLLMNRCSGLLFARDKLQCLQLSPEAADFIGRNQAKAKLAFGDVLLAAEGQYHWSCHTRHQRLFRLEKKWPWLEKIQLLHREGVEFKLHPQRAAPDVAFLARQQEHLTELGLALWLWLENRRLGAHFANARDYALSNRNKCPETNVPRNCLVNIKTFGPGSLLQRDAFRYPRQRLFHALTLLLWEPQLLGQPPLLQRVRSELNTTARGFSELVSAYKNLWARFN